MRWSVPSMWKGGECWIMGGGPSFIRDFGIHEDTVKAVINRDLPSSAYSDYLSPIHDKHVIGINNAYQIGNWIDIVFFGDCSWYLTHRRKLAEFPGLKVTCCNRFLNKPKADSEGIKYLEKDKSHKRGISKRTSFVSWNNNSGAAAISLAAHLGVKRIILLGFDMAIEKKSKISHWHGSHGRPGEHKRSPPFKRHLMGFPLIAEDAKIRGIEIINANPKSMIPDFKKVPLEGLI